MTNYIVSTYISSTIEMRSHTRYVICLVAALTGFSLYTIVSNKPAANYSVGPEEITIGYDEADEAKFLEQGGSLEMVEPKSSRNTEYKTNSSSSDSTNLKDLLHLPRTVEKFDFQSCTMKNCFDFSRCNTSETLRVHIVDGPTRAGSNFINVSGESNIIHKNMLKIIRESIYFEPDPDKACVFVPADDTLDRDPLSSSFRPYLQDLFQRSHQFGMNYIIFNLYSGSWPDYRENDFSNYNVGAAILAKASNSVTYHRGDFDISIPLFSYLHPVQDSLSYEAALLNDYQANKTYFLTFKGKRYVIGSGSETRNSLYHLNNQRDVIMLTTCRHGKKWQRINDTRCSDDEIMYGQYDFVNLMRESTFCLTPRGRRLGSFRFLEALRYGCIPVVLSDGWVWPFGEIIDWSEAAIQYDEELVLLLPDILRDISSEQIEKMRNNCHRLYRDYFSSLRKIVLTTLSIVEKRIKDYL